MWIMSTPNTSLLASQNAANTTNRQNNENEYDPAFQGSIYLPSKRKRRGTLQSLKYHDDDAPFQLIPYYPYKDKYEKYLYSHIPILFWIPRYKWKSYLIYDIMSGATAIVMVIPQSMGFALIASYTINSWIMGSMYWSFYLCIIWFMWSINYGTSSTYCINGC